MATARRTLEVMPTRRTFDLIIITVPLVHLAIGLVRMGARRWRRESTGPMTAVGTAVGISQGR